MLHPYLLHNDDVRDAREAGLAPGQLGLLAGWGVFTTLRVYDGVLFEWQRHWERMRHDAERIRVPFPSEARWIEEGLYRLIDANRAENATLRLVVVRNRGGLWEGPAQTREFDVIALTANVVKWPTAAKLGLQKNGRHAASEFSGCKYLSWAENLTRYERAHEQGMDEVVLLNERGELAECTSANIFVVEKEDGELGDGVKHVWTPPLAAGCLPGVTRSVLLSDIHVPGVKIGEKVLTQEALFGAEEVFITSTTRELLRVSHIDGRRIATGTTASGRLSKAFHEYTQGYVSKYRRQVTLP